MLRKYFILLYVVKIGTLVHALIDWCGLCVSVCVCVCERERERERVFWCSGVCSSSRAHLMVEEIAVGVDPGVWRAQLPVTE